jgi:hypothetical protein
LLAPHEKAVQELSQFNAQLQELEENSKKYNFYQ